MALAIPRGAVLQTVPTPTAPAPTLQRLAPRSAEDGNRLAIQKEGDDGHENALDNHLNHNLAERYLREAGSVQCEIEGQIDRQRSSGNKCCRMQWIEFRLPNEHSEACRQKRCDEESASPKVRDGPETALRAVACQPTMIRAPAGISESPPVFASSKASLRERSRRSERRTAACNPGSESPGRKRVQNAARSPPPVHKAAQPGNDQARPSYPRRSRARPRRTRTGDSRRSATPKRSAAMSHASRLVVTASA